MNGSVGGSKTFQRTTKHLYRDCMRLIRHIAPGMFTNRKNIAMRTMVRTEFRKNKFVTDPDQLEVCKANAIRALSNYYVLKSVNNDDKVHAAASAFHKRSVQQAADLSNMTPSKSNS